MRLLFAAILAIATMGTAWAQDDRHSGYYYPEVASEEDFDRVFFGTPPASKQVRDEFATVLNVTSLGYGFAPRYALSVKGANSEKMILVALDDQIFSSLYRARAQLALLTSDVRAGDFFREQGLQFDGTFYDMLQILEFDTLVISDGANWAHKVNFIRK